MLWTETYRPETFDEVAGNSGIVQDIRAEVESGNMNHMMFLGPPGIGKTTTAQVIATEMYGSPENSQFMELNASDERGIDVIRNKVKKFAGRKTLNDSHKIIFLDEADSLTREAQQALRRTMENYQESCRFILTGNYEGGLIDAIQSRCSVYKFEPISQEESENVLNRIVRTEGLDISDEVISTLAQVYSGDLRRQVNKLQALSAKDNVTVEDLEEGEGYIQLFKLIADRNFMAAKRKANEKNLRHMYNYLMQRDDVPGRVKADVSITYAKYMWRVNRSPDKQIQLNAMVAELIKELHEHIKRE